MMGDNRAYTIMEQTVIAAYNAGLRGEQLAPFLEPYRNTDIDEGGRMNLETTDGKSIDLVLAEAFAPEEDVAVVKRYESAKGLSDDELFELEMEFNRVMEKNIGRRFGWW